MTTSKCSIFESLFLEQQPPSTVEAVGLVLWNFETSVPKK